MSRRAAAGALALLGPWLIGCGEPPVRPVFPAGYAALYQEVRPCRHSADHDLNYVKVLADAAALAPYQGRAAPFPKDAVVLKVEYLDDACAQLVGFTAMRKEAPGTASASNDWSWQKVDAQRKVLESGQVERCIGCHQACGRAPSAYDLTCAEP